MFVCPDGVFEVVSWRNMDFPLGSLVSSWETDGQIGENVGTDANAVPVSCLQS